MNPRIQPVFAALHLAEPRPERLAALSDRDWRDVLDYCDRSQLTLVLRDAARGFMPTWVRERTDRDAANNVARLRTTEELYRTLRTSLSGIDFLALKGLAQCPDFVPRPESRVQYDVDLYAPPEHLARARDAVLSLGFESFEDLERFPTGHIPPLIRKTGWEWRGDYFDPEIPLAIELHFEFWNPAVEKLPIPDVDRFWTRRIARPIAGVPFSVLGRADALGFSSLHLLRHVFRGSVRPFHGYELASFLQSHAVDDAFWRDWRSLHSPQFRRLQAVAFRLAMEWFGCNLGPVAAAEVDALARATAAWFHRYAAAPLFGSARFGSAKEELWLHLSLLGSRRDAWGVIRRRLLPTQLPGAVDAVHIPDSELTARRRLLKHTRYLLYLACRFWRHAAALPRVVWAGARWWWTTRQK